MEWFDLKTYNNVNSLNVIEEIWGVKLPTSFKELIIKVNGGYSNLNTFDTENSKQRCFSGFLNFDIDYKNNVLIQYDWICDRLPKKVFPFSEDPGGNYLCFEYLENHTEPRIVFWHHEFYIKDNKECYDIDLIANSFDEFIGKLYHYEDDDEIDFSQFEVLS